MIGLSRRSRRRVRVAGLRTVRAIKRHHFSMLTAILLGGLLLVALTSSAFTSDESERPRAVGDTFTPWPTATPGIMPLRTRPEPSARVVVYYVVESDAQKREVEAALRNDPSYGLHSDGFPVDSFVVVRRYEGRDVILHNDELAMIESMATAQVRVVDLRP